MIEMYYNSLRDVKILSREEERAAFLDWKSSGSIESRDLLIKGNLRLVFSIAKSYAKDKNPNTLMELISAGNEGLMYSLSKYDPDKGTKFSTYCGSWILMYIRRFAVSENHLIKPPSSVRRKAKMADSLRNTNNPLSFDESYMSSSEDDISEEYQERDLQIYNAKTLLSLLSFLHPRERYIVEYSYGIGDKDTLSLRALGKRLSLSSERIRQIKLSAINSLNEWGSFYA